MALPLRTATPALVMSASELVPLPGAWAPVTERVRDPDSSCSERALSASHAVCHFILPQALKWDVSILRLPMKKLKGREVK